MKRQSQPAEPIKDVDAPSVVEEAAAPAELAVEAAPAPVVAPAEVRTAEAWAEAKGFLPEFISVATPFARPDAPRARQHNPEFWRFHATRTGLVWPIGKELTEKEFDDAVELSVNGHQYR